MRLATEKLQCLLDQTIQHLSKRRKAFGDNLLHGTLPQELHEKTTNIDLIVWKCESFLVLKKNNSLLDNRFVQILTTGQQLSPGKPQKHMQNLSGAIGKMLNGILFSRVCPTAAEAPKLSEL